MQAPNACSSCFAAFPQLGPAKLRAIDGQCRLQQPIFKAFREMGLRFVFPAAVLAELLGCPLALADQDCEASSR